jgi:DNA-binding transcriptional LysR family regulator
MAESSRYYFKELRLQQFRGLVALARWQTFTAAANALGLTRASVWQQVRALEQELTSTLVRTRGHRVELTDAGHKLVEMVAPLVAGFDSVKTAFSAIQETLPQTLVIATAPTFIVYELHGPVSQVNALFPKLHLIFLERNSPVAIEVIEQGGADIAVVAKPDNLPMSRTLEYVRLTTYPFTLIGPPDHPLMRKKTLTLADFTRHPLILPGTAAYCRQRFDTVLGAAGLAQKLHVVLESNFPVLYFEYVRMGMGVALTPLPPESRLRGRLQQTGVALRSAEHLFGGEPIYYVRRKGQFETPYATKFRELVVSQYATPSTVTSPKRGSD